MPERACRFESGPRHQTKKTSLRWLAKLTGRLGSDLGSTPSWSTINGLDMVLPTGTTGSIPVRSTNRKCYSKPELNLVKGIRPKNLSRGRRTKSHVVACERVAERICAGDVIGSLTWLRTRVLRVRVPPRAPSFAGLSCWKIIRSNA